MTSDPHVLWLSVSPFLKCFNQRLLAKLAKSAPVRCWEYYQTADEPCCIDAVVAALHEYVSDRGALERSSGQAHPKVHLLGHGVSGVVALLHARRYPEQVASVTLLSVNPRPAVNWQAHYYAMRQLLPCDREVILGQMARLLFGQQSPRFATALIQLLAKDLDSNLTLHSLAHHANIPPGGADVPLLVCNGEMDAVLCGQGKSSWKAYLKASDRLWLCPQGKHFFHFHQVEATAEVIVEHWHQSILKDLPVGQPVEPARGGCASPAPLHSP